MKKTISLILSLFIFLINATVGFSADLLTVYFDPYEKSTEEKAIITSSAATDELNLYVAAYKEDKMVSVKKSNLTLEQGINVVETGIDWSDMWKDKVKLFVWDEALCPYDSYEFAVTRPPVSLLSTFVVTANSTINYNGNTAYRLSGTINGKESRIIVYNSDGYGEENPENFSADDVILISAPDGEGVVSYVEKLDAEKIEGIVTQTPMTNVAYMGVYDPADTPAAIIGGQEVTVDNKLSVDTYLGKTVTAYIADGTLCAISEKTDSNTSFTISASQLVDAGDRYFNEENVIGYMPSLSTSKLECTDLDADVVTYYNYNKKIDINTTSELAALVAYGGTIEFISNDADSDIECMIATSYEDEAVIKSIGQDGTSYKFDCYSGAISEIDTTDTDRKVVIYKDGIISTVDNLEVEDTISHVEVARDFDIYYASSENVLGLADAYSLSDYIIAIEGNDYKVSPFYNVDITSLMGKRGIFYLNIVGEVSHFEEDNTARSSYALVTATYKEQNVDLAYYIQAVFEDGEVAEYEIAKKADIKDENNESVLTERTDLKVKSYFNRLLTEEGNTGLADATYRLKVSDLTTSVPENLLVTITVRNGKIRRIKLPHGTNFYCEANAQYDADTVTIMNKQISKETIVFAVKPPENINNFINVDKIKTGTVLEYFTDGESYGNISLYDKKSSNNFYGALVALDLEKPQIPSSSVFVVASKKMVTYNDDEAYQVTGRISGNERTFTIYNENGYGNQTPDQLKAGDVLIMKEQPSEDGVISDFQQVFSLDKQSPESSSVFVTEGLADGSSKIYSGYGMLNASTETGFSINANITDDYDLSVKNSSGASIPYDSEADYTLVDFTENFRTPEISSKSSSESLFSAEYNTYVYVRYVDGKKQDVVVYRFTKQS